MTEKKQLINGYDIIQSVKIDGMEIVVGENPDAKKPYMMWRRSIGESFGAETHLIPVYVSDYLKILREFIHCQSIYADNIGLDRIYRGSPDEDAALTAGDCVESDTGGNLAGRIVAIKADLLSPEYRVLSHQLMLVTNSSDCSQDAHSQAIFGVNIYSSSREQWKRSDILGVIDQNTLPGWAREKLAALKNPAAKESVINKIRQSKQDVGLRKPQQKTHKKGGPER